MTNKENINSSLYKIDISSKLGNEYVEMFQIITYQVTMQTIIQYMIHISSPTSEFFLNGDFISFVMFIITGISFYYLVIKKIFVYV